jgi:hypothetical protein
MPLSRRELVLYTVLGLLCGLAYFVTCRLVTSPVEVAMPAWVPFLPILTIPYLLQVVVSYLLAMFITDTALRHAVFKAYFLSLAATFAIWLAYPTTMPRPSASTAWWDWPFAVMAHADLPVHVFPAGHILMPVLIVWAFAYHRPRWLIWLVPAELVGTAGIATTWQHRPSDILVGALLAAGSGVLFGVGRHAKAARVAAA